jgi:hypothetical protein
MTPRKAAQQHQVLKLPRCRACGSVLPKPYKRKYYSWGQVHYVRCQCGKRDAIDVT